MGEFFTSWRRKAGLFTLVLACVCMADWERSRSTVDVVVVNKQMILASAGNLIWDTIPPSWATNGYHTRWSNKALKPTVAYFISSEVGFVSKVDWHFHVFGLGVGEYTERRVLHQVMAVSHWLIILVLTLLSALLLISTPRKSTSEKLPEPNQNEGA